MSGKGGVGKSSVAAYLAVALAKRGYSVGLMDVDLHGPSIPRLLGLKGTVSPGPREGKARPVPYLSNMEVISITGDEPLTAAQTIPDAMALIVTTPQEISLADVRKSIHFCRRVHMTILGMVENMSGLVCPYCGKTIDIFKTKGGMLTAQKEGLELLGTLPLAPQVVLNGDCGGYGYPGQPGHRHHKGIQPDRRRGCPIVRTPCRLPARGKKWLRPKRSALQRRK